MRELVAIRKVEPVRDFVVRLEFSDGSSKEVDLAIVSARADLRADARRSGRLPLGSRRFATRHDCLAERRRHRPDVLYHGMKPAWLEEETIKHA